jgi:hypothetical protein
MNFGVKARYPLMAAGMICLLAGVTAGILRLSINLLLVNPTLASIHGPLMVCGFLGTVIGLERAVALGKLWGYSAPFFAAIGGLMLLAGIGGKIPIVFFIASSVALASIYAVIIFRQPEMFNITMALGAVAWWGGNILWIMEYPLPFFVLWWGGFVILTIAGERLELSRFAMPPQNARLVFTAIVGALFSGMVVEWFDAAKGSRVMGLAILATAIWLLIYDIARRTVLQKGVTRFVAVSLLLGYVWLGFSGTLLALNPDWQSGLDYDAILHSLFLGFAFSMIFGHAPIIFPAVLKVSVPYSPLFYFHLALLHISLFIRIMADVFDLPDAHIWGGALNAAAIALFLGNTVLSVIRGRSLPA